MKAKLQQRWQQLTDSLWFIPGLMIVSAMALGLGLVELEVYYPIRGSTKYPLLFGVGAEGSRSMLSAIAGSMLTVAGLSFTLTLSAISQVSGQYSPRLLRNFMKDRINQFAMGYFTGSFAYCLIVLRTIRGSDELTFVPSTAVLTGLLLALGGVLTLILFIHHIAESMQISTIIYKIMDETTAAIDRLFPQELGEPAHAKTLVDKAKRLIDEPTGWIALPASQSGYLQQIHSELLLDWAVDHQMLVRLEYAIGDFVGKGFPLLSVRPVNEQQDATVLTSNESEALQDCLQLGRYRTVEQDVRFGIQQLVDIITGALTPSTNDTTTAIMAIDHLCVIISRLATRPFPSPFRAEDNQLYVLTRSASFAQMMTDAFDPIRISGKANHAIFVTLLRVYERLTAHTHDTARLSIIKQQIKLVREASDTTLETSYEKELVNAL